MFVLMAFVPYSVLNDRTSFFLTFSASFTEHRLHKKQVEKFMTLGCEISDLDFIGGSALKTRQFCMHLTSDFNLLIVDRACRNIVHAIPHQPKISSDEITKLLLQQLPSDTHQSDISAVVMKFALRYSLPEFLINRFKKVK